MTTLAFDIYGTLINTRTISSELYEFVGAKTDVNAFAELWRQKQLEYSFRRGLMRQYDPFDVCIRQALEYCCQTLHAQLDETQKQTVMDLYSQLPIFDDVELALDALSEHGFNLVAFSNGSRVTVEKLLNHNRIAGFFNEIISVDEVQSFKPDPMVYQHLVQRVQVLSDDRVWLVSANAFDVQGAMSANLEAIWLQRSRQQIFDSWLAQPSVTVRSLLEIKQQLDPV